MDKKLTQRIISVLVVVALVIIVLPLVINGVPASASSLQTAEIKAPPFPEPQNGSNAFQTEKNLSESLQTTTVAANETALPPSKTGSMLRRIISPEKYQSLKSAITALVTPAAKKPAPAKANTTVTTVASTPAPTHAAKNTQDTQDEQSFPSTHVVTTALEAKEELDKAEQLAMESEQLRDQYDEIVKANESAKSNAAENVLVVNSEGGVVQVSERHVRASAHAAKVMQTASMKAPVKAMKSSTRKVAAAKALKTPASALTTHNMSANLSNLKKAGWAVQMGSFRNKDNAARLANRLRAKGYKVFTHETKSNKITAVYVGPELKEVSAMLVNRLHKDLNMRGVIVSYKPLAV